MNFLSPGYSFSSLYSLNYSLIFLKYRLLITLRINTSYTTGVNISLKIGRNNSEIIVVIKHAEATNLISNL